MKRLVGFVVVVCSAALVLAPSAWNAAAAQDKAKGDTVLFLVLPNRLIGNPHLALKDGKSTEVETVAVLGDANALNASQIKLTGMELAKGKYLAEQCKLSGKDAKPIILQIYFARNVPAKTKLTDIKYKGEAVASYKLGFGEGKDKPVHVFEASVAK